MTQSVQVVQTLSWSTDSPCRKLIVTCTMLFVFACNGYSECNVMKWRLLLWLYVPDDKSTLGILWINMIVLYILRIFLWTFNTENVNVEVKKQRTLFKSQLWHSMCSRHGKQPPTCVKLVLTAAKTRCLHQQNRLPWFLDSPRSHSKCCICTVFYRNYTVSLSFKLRV